MTHTFLPILIMLIIATGVGGVILGLNWVIGRHQRNPSKLAPYESGVPPLDQNRKRINVRFYQIAMLFILFDIETAFLYPWATVFRDMGMEGFIGMAIFLAVLASGYLYCWRRGALDWD